ncbi:hypothetical protein B0H12DRAFT_1217928 [Mycena haematopus]|nr:hypothetical protein B0H12DRAFT_1217928 [Mycena haematopus]
MSDPATNKRGASPTRKVSSTEAMSTTTKSSSTTTKTSKSSGSTASAASTFISNTVTSASTKTTTSSRQLSQCTLTLRETILTIESDGDHVTVNLNLYVAYIGGQLRWVPRGTGGFRNTCQEKSIKLEGTVLVALCREGHSGDYQQVQLDLSDRIIFDSETKAFRPDELEFTLTGAEKIIDSSRSLMDITLISSFNLAKLLREPAFHKAITDVAERAENDAHDQRLAVVSQMNEKVEEIKEEVDELKKRLERVVGKSEQATEEMKNQLESISKESAQRFEREMTTLINAVAKEAMNAVYAQIRELTVLTVEQQKAYEVNWPPPPYKSDGTPESVN